MRSESISSAISIGLVSAAVLGDVAWPQGRTDFRFRQVRQAKISPDGSQAVFLADQRRYDVFELYSVDIDGGRPAKRISGRLPIGGDVVFFEITPCSDRVVYVADQHFDDTWEIYSVPIDGSSLATKLNPGLIAGGSVNPVFAISGDCSRVVYLADQEQLRVLELFSVPASGGSSVKISGPLLTNGDVEPGGFHLTPDGARVIYSADARQRDVHELFSVPIDGSAPPVALNTTPVRQGDIGSFFQISPDGERVVYRGDQDVDELYELYSVPIDGSSTPTKLNPPLASGERVAQYWSKITPDGRRVVLGVQPWNQFDLCDFYSVGFDGSPPAFELERDVVAGPEIFLGYQFTPDGKRVVYRADPDEDGTLDLFSSPVARPGGTIHLSKTEAPVFVEWFRMSPDGAYIAFRAIAANGVRELYSVPTDGSASPIELDQGVDIQPDFQFTPAGDHVVYHLGLNFQPFGFRPGQLRSVAIKGGEAPVTLDRGSVNDFFQVSSDSRYVVFTATRDSPLVVDVYSVPIDGSTPPIKLNGPFLPERTY